jgi:RNA polymerase-binding transcription factor
MARTTRKSLAGQAASAARKVISRRPVPQAADEPAPTTAAPAKKAAGKKAPAKKAAAKKAPPSKKAAPTTKKAAPAKAVAAKRSAPTKQAAVKKPTATANGKKVPAKKAPAKKAPAKKAPAKKPAAERTRKAPVSALVVKEGEGAWTKTELAEVLDELHTQSEHSRAIIATQEAELSGLMRDAGDGAGHDQADMGATSFERDHELTVLSNERDKLAQIERALARIDDGTYGVCESCGNPIGKMRLMAFPRATLCLPCKQREERR